MSRNSFLLLIAILAAITIVILGVLRQRPLGMHMAVPSFTNPDRPAATTDLLSTRADVRRSAFLWHYNHLHRLDSSVALALVDFVSQGLLDDDQLGAWKQICGSRPELFESQLLTRLCGNSGDITIESSSNLIVGLVAIDLHYASFIDGAKIDCDKALDHLAGRVSIEASPVPGRSR